VTGQVHEVVEQQKLITHVARQFHWVFSQIQQPIHWKIT